MIWFSWGFQWAKVTGKIKNRSAVRLIWPTWQKSVVVICCTSFLPNILAFFQNQTSTNCWSPSGNAFNFIKICEFPQVFKVIFCLSPFGHWYDLNLRVFCIPIDTDHQLICFNFIHFALYVSTWLHCVVDTSLPCA